MSTSAVSIRVSKKQAHVATSVRLTDSMLYVALSDGREIGVPLSRFPWLAKATAAHRNKWHIEPHGFAVYWDDLDDGIEIDHLLG
ncbi:MAG: DUF2442 domain-containing protein [Chloroflexota bacterium]|nr:DUF2442 domain-containing protein [Chloroflexota bacterium]